MRLAAFCFFFPLFFFFLHLPFYARSLDPRLVFLSEFAPGGWEMSLSRLTRGNRVECARLKARNGREKGID